MKVPNQDKLLASARSVWATTLLSTDEIRAMAYACARTRDFIDCLKADVAEAAAANTPIDPQQLAQWLALHVPQLNLETVQQEMPQ